MNPADDPTEDQGSQPEPIETSGDPSPIDPGQTQAGPRATSAEPSKSSASLVGCRLGEYQVLRKLGRGGMADVYAAKQLSLNRDVALKVLRKQFAMDEAYVKRFRREATAAAKLNHPNIVGVYDVKQVEDQYFIAQELIDGANLREQLDRRGPLDADEGVRVLMAVGQALEVAAEAGITHRDIKPENIMHSSRGEIKVADFGLARLGPEPGRSHAELTQAGLTLGTPRYMSPEQIQGRQVDSRSDLYSLGVTMYHLLTGRPPFEAEDPLALAVMHLHETPPPIDKARGSDDLPPWLVTVIGRLISKMPEDRFQSASEMLDVIRSETGEGSGGWSGGAVAATTRLQRASALARRRQRRRLLRIAACVGLPLVAAVAGIAMAARNPRPDVATLLNPTEVVQAESVEAQWIEAVRRNDAAGWKAVMEYFPPELNATNQEYANRARIQLGRYLIEQNQYREADRVLDQMLADPSLRGIYQVTALILRSQVAKARGDSTSLATLRQRLTNQISKLKSSNPQQASILGDVFSDREMMEIGVTLDET
ncbi:serine/threonine-protein kinase [Crateriforma conspicua]|uniref:non-specific serine/threonine protein kinase n=1 Tax=Crateriforma conspicua TaxID=2527996 RepID=A0A5C6FWR5_9PLAN|nr:serine/threonine-protein kinase [Crateriforma conspicua]TWU67602.1 Serine/threonine-protein kinase PknB [Crateriforma conspicua]